MKAIAHKPSDQSNTKMEMTANRRKEVRTKGTKWMQNL